MRNNETNLIERGGKFYWYFWRLGNKGAKSVLDGIFLLALKCLIPVYYSCLLLKRISKIKNPVKKFPVISVGNLTMGGTGKTPCVEFLVKKLSDKQLQVGLLTRGYARKDKGNKKIDSSAIRETFTVEDMGDEPYVFSKHFPKVPIFISGNRAKSLSEASKQCGCDVFIMDDGFQYTHIEKDLEILLINKKNPFGNGSLFPAGFLREPINSMKRADLIIFTHSDESNENDDLAEIFSVLSKKSPEIPVLESVHEPLYFEDFAAGEKYQAKEIAGKRFLSLSSLADPLSFEESLRKLNLEPVKRVRFPDHYVYKSEDIKWLNALVKKENADFIATAEKDWVRLPDENKISVPVLCLIMNFKITKSEKILDRTINDVLEKYKR